ncbi:MAG: DUF494 family protein [Methanobacteriota archaeon]|nr:MAG: DUF494 family protein [Euryarchaeota archaeon]
MQERINEIIDWLLQELSHSSEPYHLDFEAISQKLLEKGYTEREIHKALEWIIMNITKDRNLIPKRSGKKSPPPIRLLLEEELRFFTPESYGYLLNLQSMGILNGLQVEQVIERCFLSGLVRVEVEELKNIVSQILMEERGKTSASNHFYHPGNDRIN